MRVNQVHIYNTSDVADSSDIDEVFGKWLVVLPLLDKGSVQYIIKIYHKQYNDEHILEMKY